MILLDSSYLVALANDRDAHHNAARRVQDRVASGEWGLGIVLEYVFVETVTVLMARRGRALAVSAGRNLLEASELEFVPCAGHFDAAWAAFQGQPQRRLSFTDAALVAVARERGIEHVATFDADLAGVRGLAAVP